MISEVDIRDWEKVDTVKALEALDNMDDYARMANINPLGAWAELNHFILTVSEIQQRQLRKIPILERK